MALESTLLDIPFAGGVSKKVDQVIPDKTRLLELTNGSFSKDLTLLRRDPWSLLPGTTSIAPIELTTLGNELLAIDGTSNTLYGYSPTSDALISRGTPPYFQLAVDNIAATINYKVGVDHASTGGFSIYVWQERLSAAGTNLGVRYSVFDEATGTPIVNGGILKASSAAGIPRVCVGGPSNGHFLVVFSSSSTAIQMVAVLASTGAIVTAATTIASDSVQVGGINYYDLARFEVTSNGLGLLAYSSSKGSTVIGALMFSYLGTVTNVEITALASGVLSGALSTLSLASFKTASAMGLFIGDAGNRLRSVVLSYASGVLSASAAADWGAPGFTPGTISACAHPTSGLLVAFAASSVAGSIGGVISYTLSTANVATASTNTLTQYSQSSTRFAFGLIATRAFASSTTVYVGVALSSALQNTIYVVDHSGNAVAVALYGQGLPYPASGSDPIAPEGKMASVAVLPDGAFSIPILKQGALAFSGGEQSVQAGISRARLSAGRASLSGVSPTPLWHAQTNNALYFSGAYLAMYDGARVQEAGFFYYPEGIALASSGVGQSGTFLVCAVYEFVDNTGARHQSAPSPSVSITVSNKGAIDMTAPPLNIGVRKGSLLTSTVTSTVVFYRTTNGGTTFYRVNPPTDPLAMGTGAVTYSDTSINSTPTSDTITGNEILYTTGGTLPNDNPPACNAIATWQGRIIYSNAEDGQDWRFSQAPILGQGLYFNETLLGGRTPQEAGAISGFGVMDDKLIIGTKTRKLAVAGQGPTASGLGGTYSPPQLLPSDVGFKDQRNIVLLPDVSAQDGAIGLQAQGGLAHQTAHGYYLLNRGLTDRYIGMPVEPLFLGGEAASSAVVLQDGHQLRVTINDTVAVLDYLMGQWSTFIASPGGGASFGCATIWGGKWTAGGAMGAVDGLALMMANTNEGMTAGLFQDSPGAGVDYGGFPVDMSLTTAWIRLGSIQGFQRVSWAVFFGPWSEPSAFTITPQYNFDSGNEGDATTVDTGELVTTDRQRWQLVYQLPIQKCESVRFVLRDSPSFGGFRGAGLSGMTLELAVKRGTVKLSAGRNA